MLCQEQYADNSSEQINGKVNRKVNGINGHYKLAAQAAARIEGPQLLDFLKKRRSVYPKDFSGEPVSRYGEPCSWEVQEAAAKDHCAGWSACAAPCS